MACGWNFSDAVDPPVCALRFVIKLMVIMVEDLEAFIAAAPRRSLYAMLGASSEATPELLKRAYRRSCLWCHPDKNPDDAARAGEAFLLVNAAYEILSDGAKRRAYDAELERERRSRPRTRDPAKKSEVFSNLQKSMSARRRRHSEEAARDRAAEVERAEARERAAQAAESRARSRAFARRAEEAAARNKAAAAKRAEDAEARLRSAKGQSFADAASREAAAELAASRAQLSAAATAEDEVWRGIVRGLVAPAGSERDKATAFMRDELDRCVESHPQCMCRTKRPWRAAGIRHAGIERSKKYGASSSASKRPRSSDGRLQTKLESTSASMPSPTGHPRLRRRSCGPSWTTASAAARKLRLCRAFALPTSTSVCSRRDHPSSSADRAGSGRSTTLSGSATTRSNCSGGP